MSNKLKIVVKQPITINRTSHPLPRSQVWSVLAADGKEALEQTMSLRTTSYLELTSPRQILVSREL